jgi:lambda family phage minor tail protein L
VTTRQDERRKLDPDTVVELFELDYSNLAGDPGNPAWTTKFSNQRVSVYLDSDEYIPLPIRCRGFEISSDGSVPRPTITVANGNGLISGLIDAIGGSLTGATLYRRTVFARNLDGGSHPDSRQVWEPGDAWRIERKIRHTRFTIEFQLSAKVDIQNTRLPGRSVDATLCPFTYKAATTCKWDPTGGPWFDGDGESLPDANGDACGLRPSDCTKRFSSRGEPARFGGYPAAGKAIR